MTPFETILKDAALHSGAELSDEILSMYSVYSRLLKEWNEKINLTAITDDEGIAIKHFADSLSLLKFVNLPQGASLADVGTGAGFPGLAILIARPDIKLCLIDSTAKRLKFLETVLNELGLSAETLHIRAEDAGREKSLRESFDIVCARAVAALPLLSEYCVPLVKRGGEFAALKGRPEDSEIQSGQKVISLLGGEKARILDYELINGDNRTIIITKKISQTPPKYPRSSAAIAKKPWT